MAEFDELFDGLVLRALICKRCQTVLPVAFDEEQSMKRIKARHLKPPYRGGTAQHEAWMGDEQIAIWHVSEGRVSVPFEKSGIILRVRAMPSEPTP